MSVTHFTPRSRRNPNTQRYVWSLCTLLCLTVCFSLGCKEKKQPPPEAEPAKQSTEGTPPTEPKSPTAGKSSAKKKTSSETSSNSSENASQPSPTKSATVNQSPQPTSNPSPSPRPTFETGSTDRDGDVSLNELAATLSRSIDRAGRAFQGGDAESALAEAIQARQKLPSPAQVAAIGERGGAEGIALAEKIEVMRRKLDRALDKLDRAGAGQAPSSVTTQNIVIQ